MTRSLAPAARGRESEKSLTGERRQDNDRKEKDMMETGRKMVSLENTRNTKEHKGRGDSNSPGGFRKALCIATQGLQFLHG